MKIIELSESSKETMCEYIKKLRSTLEKLEDEFYDSVSDSRGDFYDKRYRDYDSRHRW